mmetsp:Transcript_21313/g.54221  ORF Transcript_21313/g.54221 Transcript_21313/m.54221 type:complete len:228 (+) Transcript_21313:2764-3447(+)
MGSDAEKGDEPASSWFAAARASSSSCASRASGPSAASAPGGGGMRVPGGSSTAILWSPHSADRSGSVAPAASSGVCANTMARAGCSGSSPSASRSRRSRRASSARRRDSSHTTYLCDSAVGMAASPSLAPTRSSTGSRTQPAATAVSTCAPVTVAPTSTTCGRSPPALLLTAALSSMDMASVAERTHSSYSSTTSTRRWSRMGCRSSPAYSSMTAAGVATTTCTPRR